jgi:acyl transferase domain-containing protein
MRVSGKSKVPGPKSSASAAKAKDPIAIIGIGCRYPGASNVEELWQNLLAGKDSIGPYASGRILTQRRWVRFPVL